MEHYFTNIIGVFILDNNFKITNLTSFSTEELGNREQKVKDILQRYPKALPLPQEKLPLILTQLKDKKYFQEFYQKNLCITKKALKLSVTEDQLIIQAIANINEIDKITNTLNKRLREWYSLYCPELSENLTNNEKFTEIITLKTKQELLQELNLSEEQSMGAALSQYHLQEMIYLAEQIQGLYQLRKKHEQYLEKVMKEYCPNLLELAGTTIGARLIELGKGLKNLALLPASTIQLLGAEKALFRHIKTGSKSPKFGVIINHPIIQHAARENKGKASRSLADKLSLCLRLDYFKGEFKAPEYKKGLEEKFK